MSTFRKEYKPVTDDVAHALDEVKTRAEAMENTINFYAPVGRYRALAITKLEEAVMWAVKGVTE